MKVIRWLQIKQILLKRNTKKIISQDEGIFGNFQGSLMKVGLPLMEKVVTPLAKSVLITLRLTETVFATDVAI